MNARWLAVAALLVLPSSLPAQSDDEWVTQIQNLMRESGAFYLERGYVATQIAETSRLRPGESESFRFTLEPGVEYSIFAQCDRDCSDIDLTLYDPGDNEVDKDVETDDVPILMFTTTRGGTYRLKATMVTCKEAPCYYGIAAYRKSGTASASSSGGSRYVAQVRERLQTRAAYYTGAGYTQAGDPYTGSLDEDEAESLSVSLSSGTSYALVAVCDEDCTDLDLALFDDAGKEVSKDVAADKIPLLMVTPSATGSYRLRVSMAGCSAEPCAYGVGVFKK